jgi:hypothetical protein
MRTVVFRHRTTDFLKTQFSSEKATKKIKSVLCVTYAEFRSLYYIIDRYAKELFYGGPATPA